jgi:hypothetical protein
MGYKEPVSATGPREFDPGSNVKSVEMTRGIGMPPLIVWALGALGAILVGRWIANEARRRSAELRARRAEGVGRGEREQARTLERDPVTGIYRPK